MRISPQTSLAPSRFLLQPFKDRVTWRILPIPPAPDFFMTSHELGAAESHPEGVALAALT